MIIVGLTGSIAMGKSEVASIFRENGIPVFDADKEVHALYNSPEGANLLRPYAPDAVTASGVDRSKLSAAVFHDETLLNKLEPVVHTEIARRRANFVENAEADGHAMVLVDVPLLFEKGGDKDVDVTIVVSAPPQLQRPRALARPGMTPAKLDMILARQMPDAEKRKRADHVLENDGSIEDLRHRTLDLIQQLKHKRHTHA